MKLRITLRSDSAFGRGDGIAGLVDTEVEHDARTGFPLIKGRTLKGLLVEACADWMYALQIGSNPALPTLEASAKKLFGVPGSTLDDMGCLHVGAAQLPADLRQFIESENATSPPEKKPYPPPWILESLTTIRHQTAVDPTSGKPKDGSLRSTRVVLRGTFFDAPLHSTEPLGDVDYEVLAACAAGVKRGGQNRARGLGWLQVDLLDAPGNPLDAFISRIGGAA
jgi:hypothetical protein